MTQRHVHSHTDFSVLVKALIGWVFFLPIYFLVENLGNAQGYYLRIDFSD